MQGKITIGIYPILPGDNCNFLVIDFDKENCERDVTAFWNTCDELEIPMYVERSRSGNGAHVWIFFKESIPARIARKMGNILLTKTMEKASLNEVEKNQIDILSNIKRIKSDEIYAFIDKYKEDDYKEPDMEEISDDEEIPKKENIKDTIFTNNVECIFDNQIYIKKLKLLPNEITYLKRLASFTNPKFYELQKLRMPIFYKTTPRIISCFEEDERFLKLPRGCIDKIVEVCEKSNVKLIIKDTR